MNFKYFNKTQSFEKKIVSNCTKNFSRGAMEDKGK